LFDQSIQGDNMVNRRSLLGSTLAAGAAGAGLLSSLNQSAHAADSKAITVGSALPMSGFAASDGIEFKRGLEMAAEEINAAGGVLGQMLEIKVEDTKEMGADVVTQAMQRLIDRNKAPVIINGYNLGTNMVEMDVAADNHVMFLHYNTVLSHDNKFNSKPERYYSCFQGDPAEYWYGQGVLNFFKQLTDSKQWTPANKKLAIIASADEYPITISNAIKAKAAEYGWEISLFETVPFPTTQWGPAVTADTGAQYTNAGRRFSSRYPHRRHRGTGASLGIGLA
jgi:branched-chain amino acid transport system substrate-binding protein